MIDDDGWIRTLLEEAENELMHLMSFVAIAKANVYERFIIMAVRNVIECCQKTPHYAIW